MENNKHAAGGHITLGTEPWSELYFLQCHIIHSYITVSCQKALCVCIGCTRVNHLAFHLHKDSCALLLLIYKNCALIPLSLLNYDLKSPCRYQISFHIKIRNENAISQTAIKTNGNGNICLSPQYFFSEKKSTVIAVYTISHFQICHDTKLSLQSIETNFPSNSSRQNHLDYIKILNVQF